MKMQNNDHYFSFYNGSSSPFPRDYYGPLGLAMNEQSRVAYQAAYPFKDYLRGIVLEVLRNQFRVQVENNAAPAIEKAFSDIEKAMKV